MRFAGSLSPRLPTTSTSIQGAAVISEVYRPTLSEAAMIPEDIPGMSLILEVLGVSFFYFPLHWVYIFLGPSSRPISVDISEIPVVEPAPLISPEAELSPDAGALVPVTAYSGRQDTCPPYPYLSFWLLRKTLSLRRGAHRQIVRRPHSRWIPDSTCTDHFGCGGA